MKKLTISILLLILFNKAYSQKFYLTPKGGITFSSQTNKIQLIGEYSNAGLNFGGALEYKITKLFSLQTEISYIQKGFKENSNKYRPVDPLDPILTNDYIIKTRLDYLEIPLLLKINFGSKKVKFYGYTGASFSYFLGEKSNLYLYNSYINKFNIGWQVGAGCKLFLFGPGAIVFDIHYDASISKFNKGNSSNIPRNNCFAFNVGYAFPLGKK